MFSLCNSISYGIIFFGNDPKTFTFTLVIFPFLFNYFFKTYSKKVEIKRLNAS